ncbi:hypothetical protein [Novosphingobium cyanobacteriorum]|uniref:Uncharacterized protein n=1 Tax=Novosphingobium cyanobacteriorum TaxID=3024215 RepID=A0ABT6CEK0_9SPHN|nr:hypothetical protein [Novosphingobium cyanobacteriorum]MDF8332346.1 hypothetical protein [Novosphingobium cyanobacteriorum]
MEDNAFPARLSLRQSIVMIVAALALWYSGALLVQALSSAGMLGGSAGVIAFVLTVPGTLPFVLALRTLAGLSSEQVVPGCALTIGTVIVCDGMAVTWHPAFYGVGDTAVRLSAGAVLFGGGVALLLAFGVAAWMRRRG